jgi:hypothetical protein
VQIANGLELEIHTPAEHFWRSEHYMTYEEFATSEDINIVVQIVNIQLSINFP